MIVERDIPITVDDGLVLRADVFRPDDQTPAPVVMILGPYGKGVEYKSGYKAQWDWLTNQHPELFPGSSKSYEAWETVDPEIWTAWGYVCVRVDSRGTGRSPGKLDILSKREIKDFYDAIEWAGVQPWSNGKVGLNGISYYAMNQWRVAQLHPPHLTAMIPWEGCGDAYREWFRHGGILSNTFFDGWYHKQVISNQHGNSKGHDDPWLQQKATGPASLSDEELSANRTEPLAEAVSRELDDDWYRERSVDWSKVTVPFLSSGNWGGIGLHGRGNYEAFTQCASTQKWLEMHPGRHDEAFYMDNAMALQRRFFDHFLKGIDNGWDREPPVQLQLRRPEQPYSGVRKESSWPLPNTQWTKLHFSASEKTLGASPQEAKEEVAFEAANQSVSFVSDPLPQETEITGPLAAKVFVSSSTTDADLFFTVQAFSPEDKEVEFQGSWDPHTPLTQGWLRASHRKLDTARSKPYRPFHSHSEVQPLEPGNVYELDVEIWPTHIILPAGYHISLRIEGRDFERPGSTFDGSLTGGGKGSGPFIHDHPQDRGSDVYAGRTTVHTGGDTGSYLLLPVIPNTRA